MKSNQVQRQMKMRADQFAFQRAIVIGGGIAGLTAARVLADHAAQVIIVERDAAFGGPAVRRGVPQTHHPHNLQPHAQQILEGLFPGLTEELVAAQAVRLGGAEDVAFHYDGEWHSARLGGRHAILSCSRTLLEGLLYRRVGEHPRIEIMHGYEIAGLYLAGDGERVGGVRLRSRTVSDRGEMTLDGDLVVDASGRRSRAPQWLAELGYQPPEEWHIDAQVGYASRVYEQPAGFEHSWKMLYIRPTPPAGTRGGIIIPMEGNRWHVALVGVGGDYPPTDEEEFLAFAKSLPTTELYEAIKDAQPESRIHGFRRADNRVRRYDSLPRTLEGFLVVGDAAHALNPLYAQGMTSALLASQALVEVLQGHVERGNQGVRGLARTFQQEASQAVEGPWRLATRTDWRWETTEVNDNGDLA